MADTTTTNLGLTKPEVGSSADSWGDKVNANFDALDTAVDLKAPKASPEFTGTATFDDIDVTGTLNGISTTKSASGNRWGVLPEVESSGVMEVGRYLDFHSTDGDTSDYGARLEFNGTDIVSTNAFSMASGIYLGGSVAANLLDDYEEGTFTPVLTRSAGGAISATYTNQNGNYVKVGNIVYFEIYIALGTITAQGSGYAILTGLPFSQNGYAYTQQSLVTTNTFSENVTKAFASGAIMYFGTSSNTSFPPLQIAYVGSSILRISGTYKTA